MSNEIQLIQHGLIVPNPLQPRKVFDEEELKSLAESIGFHGVLQPILVRPGPVISTGERGFYLIAGERRWRASGIAGLYEVPVIVRQVSELQGGVIAAVENLQRVDQTPLEEADMILTLLSAAEESGEPMTLGQLAQMLGKGRGKGWIQNRLDLLEFGPDVHQMVSQRSETLSHAREIDGVKDQAMRSRLIDFALQGGALLPLKSLCRYIREGGAYASEEELGRFIDLFERSHSSLVVLDQKVNERLRDIEALQGTRGAPDAQTQMRGSQFAQHGGGNMSRGRMVQGVSQAQAKREIDASTAEMRRHLMNVAAWRSAARGLTPEHRRALNEARHLIEDLLTDPLADSDN
jgi:ParB/RepB/Spo0J family partition protein